jgi:hypothetical protein
MPPRSRKPRVFMPLFAGLLSLFTTAFAADSSMTSMGTTATDGKAYAARFAVGLTLDNGQTFGTSALTGQDLLIQGSISPDPAHVGKLGNLYVVERIGSSFFMKTASGTFVPWNVRVPELVPYKENVTLAQSQTVEVYKGSISVSGDHFIFIGYKPEGGTGLIYTPSALRLTINPTQDAISIFESKIADQIVMARCTLCHVKGGVADGRTDLLFVRDSSQSRQNFDLFKAFYSNRPNAYDYVLSKVSGGDRHVGGNQLPTGSANYNAMADFLTALDGRTPGATTPSASSSFFDGVMLQTNVKTLRRAAILLAGRAPTAAEEAAVTNGDDNTLRTTLRNLMQGANFHAAIKDAANDRLLVRGMLAPSFGECYICWPGFSNGLYDAKLEGLNYGGSTIIMGNYIGKLQDSMEEAPLELIARVVENDLPYSEVLTADYAMLNPQLNQAAGGNATFTTSSPTEYQPGRISGYYRQNNTSRTQIDTRVNHAVIIDPGTLRTEIAHTGVLNDMAFLARYPSTATNRNRARARWTYLHFLGVDIEQSAQRTTDPTALADRNNPTMNNENCTVCHALMDPVAGAFQDYGDNGFYKESFLGRDSLDANYKAPKTGTTLYQSGDTWYRDMRVAGFNDEAASGDTLRWLAERIVADSRFATAAVRFWWPGVIGRELLKRPEVATDSDYQARLAAYDAQEATISKLAANFTQSGMKVKGLLVDLLMSEWFRAGGIDPAKATAAKIQAHLAAGLGNEKLLTPEQMARKTLALTGFNWASTTTPRSYGVAVPGLLGDYAPYYGGIDSKMTTVRTREMTPLMGSVALSQAIESSCPIVYAEFILPDAQRKLFGGITELVTPNSAGGPQLLRAKLVDLHKKLLGQTLAADSAEINAAYSLLVDTWQSRQAANAPMHLMQPSKDCGWHRDYDFLKNVGYPGEPYVKGRSANGQEVTTFVGWDVVSPWLYPKGEDPARMKQTWEVVITYLLSHYNYLYE